MPSPFDALKALRKATRAPFTAAAMGNLYDRDTALTQAQQEMMPYLEKIKARKERRRGFLQPIETLFDLLNRGQYVTANIAQQITDNMDQGQEWWSGVPDAVRKGLTGERKGDWEKVLFGGEISGETVQGWIPWRPETKAGKIAKGVAGFGANVLLDPTTYIGFGPTTVARGAATRYADDVVKLGLKEFGQKAKTEFPKMIQAGYDTKKFGELLAKSQPEGFAYLAKYAGADITKRLSRLWKDSYRHALRTPGAKLTEEVTGRVKNLMDEITGKAISTGVRKTPAAEFGLKQITGRTAMPDEWDRLAELLAKQQGQPYAGAGTRAARFMRKEFAAGERNPAWLQAMDKMRGRFRESKLGGAFSDAWWAMMNSEKSPIAKWKRRLRIRNPYQKMLGIMERDVMHEASHFTVREGEKLFAVLDPLTEDQRQEVFGSMVWTQILGEEAKRAGYKAGSKVPTGAEQIARRFADPENADVVADAVGKIKGITDEWDKYAQWAADEGFIPDVGYVFEYLPIQATGGGMYKKAGTQLGTPRPGWAKAREMGWGKHLEQDVKKVMWMFGMDEDTAWKAVSGGMGTVNVDLKDLMLRRAFAQARLKQHVDMVQQFREFGINVSGMKKTDPEVYDSLVGQWGGLEPLGMKPVPTKGLEGYLFDTEVADIFERAAKATESDRGLRSLKNAISSFTSWWRGWATLSPGFHFRNFFSNNVTGFLKHGTEWLNPQVHAEAFVATVVGLHGLDDGIKRLTKIFPEDWVRETLAKRIGGQASLAELSEYMGRGGVIARMSRGFGEPKTFEDVARMEGRLLQDVNVNPFSSQFSGFKASQAAGGYIESTAKAQSFLLDYRRALKQGGNPETAAEWAKNEARKWWIDYGDLTPTEQKLRALVPFYTWIRGNLGNQIVGMMQFREMYAMIPKATQAIQMEGAPERRELPDWMRELGMIPTAETEEGLYRMFWPNFPYQDINKLPIRFEMRDGIPIPRAQDPWQTLSDIFQDAHPVIKTAIEVVGGVDIFFREPLGEVKKAPRLSRVLAKSPGTLAFLDGVMRHLGFDEGMRTDTNEKGQLVMDAKMVKILQQNLILLDRLPKYMDPLWLIPALDKVRERVTGAKNEYEGADRMFQVLSFYMGIKLKEADVEEEEFRRNQELLEEAYGERRKAQRYTPQHIQRSLKWKQQQRGIQRKLGL